ncbi:gamma-glutamyltransferase [Suhomyces tanzawaensis NRRL Y-17324]|uniref:Glutathione hydrolase n=1 Tax=Suhomyces tanzawaensis NRRL Y-17324 TaxID=984487 RepID=A0A1E4SMS2_9ASCO|nr:gamma-glutamyltransferase [Suhomyces tanzawaensis NRRL Y-17324]ODV80788.1 gamma-glutamyltransferase [Suhomyces tanzawaensis NRRL Y-17324]
MNPVLGLGLTHKPEYYDLLAYDGQDEPPANTPLRGPSLKPQQRHLQVGDKAMVASDIPLCSQLGKDILLQGGNAADAAVTVALCIGSINSQSSGIGGGSYIISRHNQEAVSIDAREAAPERAHKTMFAKDPMLALVGALSIATPGELKGLDELYHRHGSGNLTWKQLFEPVIELNRKGFPCTKLFSKVIELEQELVFSAIPSIRELWDFIFDDNGNLIKEGDTIRRPRYADTLELIANNGSSAIFYDPEGPIVQSLVNVTSKLGGIIAPSDFASYRVHVEKPVVLDLEVPGKSLQVITTSGVSSGAPLAAGLNFFSEVHGLSQPDPVLAVHQLIESFKWLGAIRTHFGDSRSDHERAQLLEEYSGKEWIHAVLSEGRYSPNRTFGWQNYGPQYELVDPKGTAHFSIVDEHDNAVSMTTTVNLSFGSVVHDRTTGVILNNEMDDFSQPGVKNKFGLAPSIHNFIAPFRRPLSLTSPTIILDRASNTTDMVIGAAGGSRIPTAVLQAIVRHYYQDHGLLQVMAFPRLHHQLVPEVTSVEDLEVFNREHQANTPGTTMSEALEALGHQFYENGAHSAMNGIARVGGQFHGVSDFWRKGGEAAGY